MDNEKLISATTRTKLFMKPPSETNQQRARSVNCKYYEYDEKCFDEDTQ